MNYWTRIMGLTHNTLVKEVLVIVNSQYLSKRGCSYS